VETDLFPLIIATRGRAGKAPTIQAAREQGLGHMLVVEPAEVDAYRAAYPGSLVWPLGRDGGGLPYVRQWIHDHALVLGWGWYWMPDDDITAWYQVVDGKCVATPMGEALRQSQHYFDGPKPAHQLLAQAALDLRQFAWAAKAPWKLNTYCDTVVAIHAQRARYIDYRPSTDLKADRDYTLQLITSGWLTMRISAYAFSMPTNGTNAGGCCDQYATPGREEASSREMVRLWPGLCRFHLKPNGRPDVQINWKAARGVAVEAQAAGAVP
jgi:hypothetical protein